jgi:hypothetical protein
VVVALALMFYSIPLGDVLYERLDTEVVAEAPVRDVTVVEQPPPPEPTPEPTPEPEPEPHHRPRNQSPHCNRNGACGTD